MEIPGTGHHVQQEKPDELAAVLIPFLSNHSLTAARGSESVRLPLPPGEGLDTNPHHRGGSSHGFRTIRRTANASGHGPEVRRPGAYPGGDGVPGRRDAQARVPRAVRGQDPGDGAVDARRSRRVRRRQPEHHGAGHHLGRDSPLGGDPFPGPQHLRPGSAAGALRLERRAEGTLPLPAAAG